MLIILTGKTASGKDTVMQKILAEYPNLSKVLTTTSRPPRLGEKDGIDYNFLSEEQFKHQITAGDFVEHVEYGSNLYGTQKIHLLPALQKDLIWRIDPSRAGQIRQFISTLDTKLKIVVIYLTVADEVVYKRLQNRGLSKEQIQKRMAQDQKFWQLYGQNYDYVVENIPGKLTETVGRISQIINETAQNN